MSRSNAKPTPSSSKANQGPVLPFPNYSGKPEELKADNAKVEESIQKRLAIVAAELDRRLEMQAEYFEQQLQIQKQHYEGLLRKTGTFFDPPPPIVKQQTSKLYIPSDIDVGANSDEDSSHSGGFGKKHISLSGSPQSDRPDLAKIEDKFQNKVNKMMSAMDFKMQKQYDRFERNLYEQQKQYDELLCQTGSLVVRPVELTKTKSDENVNVPYIMTLPQGSSNEKRMRIFRREITLHVTRENATISNVIKYIESRLHYLGRDDNPPPAPVMSRARLFSDPHFPIELAMKHQDQFDWKRPPESGVREPKLLHKDVDPFDLDQNSVCTAWLMAVLCCLPSHQKILAKIISSADSYKAHTTDYDGLFFCNLWTFGRWTTVYIDDRLPWYKFSRNVPWSTQIVSGPHLFWSPLVEKAYAKIQGNYDNAHNGRVQEAFLALTGGVVENIKLQNSVKNDVMDRMYNAVHAGMFVAAYVKDEMHGQLGLKSNRFFQVTTVLGLKFSGQPVYGIRLRDPHGETKWKANIPDELILMLPNMGKIDGEFWISAGEFFFHFFEIDICSYVPDFDGLPSDGYLDQEIVIRGEWKNESAPGTADPDGFIQYQKMFYNPMYWLTITEESLDQTRKSHILFQLIQRRDGSKAMPTASVCLHVFKVLHREERSRACLALMEVTNDRSFKTYFNTAYRYRLEPGDYVIMPSTKMAAQEEEFLLRIFSASKDTQCSYIKDKISVYLMRSVPEVTGGDGFPITLGQRYISFGAWRTGINAGGQIRYRTFAVNPQYILTIPDTDQTRYLLVSLKQDLLDDKRASMGFVLLKVNEGGKAFDMEFLTRHYRSYAVPEIQNKSTFVKGIEADGVFKVTNGYHLVVVFTDEPDTDRSYCLTLVTNCIGRIHVEQYNMQNP